MCLKYRAILLDGRDEFNQKRFFFFWNSPLEHFKEALDPNDWYTKYLWRPPKQGGLECCSDTFISKTTSHPNQLYMLEYLVYNVHPFGIEKNLTEALPRKLSLDEIIKLSDEKTNAAYYIQHEPQHIIEDDEKY